MDEERSAATAIGEGIAKALTALVAVLVAFVWALLGLAKKS